MDQEFWDGCNTEEPTCGGSMDQLSSGMGATLKNTYVWHADCTEPFDTTR